MLSYDNYLSLLRDKLSSHFDLTGAALLEGRTYDLHGTMNIRNTKYLLSEKVKIYNYENDEYLYLRKYGGESLEGLKEELGQIQSVIPQIIQPEKDHMSSLLTLVLVMDEEIPTDLARFAKRYRRQKGFALGFRGWADLILVIVSLKENRVVTHRNFMKTAAFFEPEKVCPKERT
ncbi:MAG: hypothetical protein PQJ59_08230 [Spirochaetales bacterium]|nr:hypothetical protein [Spirochaetales bacterium]